MQASDGMAERHTASWPLIRNKTGRPAAHRFLPLARRKRTSVAVFIRLAKPAIVRPPTDATIHKDSTMQMKKRIIGLFLSCLLTASALFAATPWADIEPPVINDVAVTEDDLYRITVQFTMPTGADGADKGEVFVHDADTGELVDSRPVGRSKNAQRTVEFNLDHSALYQIQVVSERRSEETKKQSEIYNYSYALPLEKPMVSALNTGNGTLAVSFGAVAEADRYLLRLRDVATSEDLRLQLVQDAGEFLFSGLGIDQVYEITVTAFRGREQAVSVPLSKTARAAAERTWQFTSFGQSSKKDVLNYMEMLDSDDLRFTLYSCTYDGQNGMIDSKGGKFTAFHDGVSFYYTVIDPKTENFELSATFTIDYINPAADGQEGFGLICMDSLGEDGVSGTNHYTNSASLIATKYEATIGGSKKTSKDTLGARFVTGLTKEIIDGGDEEIAKNGRSVAQAYSYDQSELVRQGDVYRLTLKKDNTGYHAIYRREIASEDTIEEYTLYGPEKLEVIDPDHSYVGFVVARGCNATVSDIRMVVTDPAMDPPAQTEPEELIPLTAKVDSPTTYGDDDYPFVFYANADGKLSVSLNDGMKLVDSGQVKAERDFTATFPIAPGFNDYVVTFTPDTSYKPGPKQTLAAYDRVLKQYVESYAPVTIMHSVIYIAYEGDSLYVSRNGSPFGKGTKADPLDLASAVSYVRPGQTIILEPGTYYLSRPLIIERGNSGTEGAAKRLIVDGGDRATLDFSMASGGMQLWGDWWEIEGLDITRTQGNVKGLQIAGDYNIVRNIRAYECGDTGIQISGTSMEPFDKWPHDNLVLGCISHDNCDPAQNNADGFAAKLTCGNGNVFRACIAYSNIDDGWDLFAKIESGPIGAVLIENCVAYRNGSLSDGFGNGDGNGFKLGGDGIAVAHVLRNSAAYQNGASGVTSNSNPALVLDRVTSYGNNGYNVALYGKGTGERLFQASGVLSINGMMADNVDETPSLLSAENYFFDGANSRNSEGATISESVFFSTDPTVTPTISADGKIDMNGLLVLNDMAPPQVGARL